MGIVLLILTFTQKHLLIDPLTNSLRQGIEFVHLLIGYIAIVITTWEQVGYETSSTLCYEKMYKILLICVYYW